MLSDWKNIGDGIRHTNIQKENFPPLLAKMMDIITPQAAANSRKCGIFSLNIEEVLAWVPRTISD